MNNNTLDPNSLNNDNNSNNRIFFITTILLVGFMVGILFIVGSSFKGGDLSGKSSSSYLLSFSELKAEGVNSFIKKAKDDLILLTESDEVQRVFDEGVFEDTNLMKATVKKVAEETSLDVQKYIADHPEMTLEELQNDEEFKKIALRRVGETGYTVFYGAETFINYLHWNPEEIGSDHAKLFEDVSRIQVANILLEGAKGEDASGFYNRKEKDGRVREKFMYISMMPDNVLDDLKLSIKATIYVDEFGKTTKLSSDLDKKLEFFQETNDYLDIVLIDLEGNVIWTAEQRNNLGTNLIDGVYKDTPLAQVYKKTEENLSFNVSDPSYHETVGRTSFFITSPLFHYDSNILEGVVVLEVGIDQIQKILKGGGIADERGEVYLIDQNKKSITDLKYIESSEDFIVETDLASSCIQNSRDSEVRRSKNYIGKNVFGIYKLIPESNWCLLVEVEYSFWDAVIGEVGGGITLYILIGVLVLAGLIALVLNNLLEIRRQSKIKENTE